MSKYILSLDQGTTSSRALLFDHDQNIVSSAQKEFRQLYPKEAWVEHDPMEIYSTQYAVMAELLAKTNVNAKDITAIGITNQRETTIIWDKNTGLPVYNAIVWQCRRTSGIVDQLKKDGLSEYITKTTGLIPDAYFSGTKIKWILDNVEGARKKAEKGEILFGTVDTWMIWKLTQSAGTAGGSVERPPVHVTDYTNASRTMIFDIHKLDWDDKLLNVLDIPRAMLPQVKPSGSIFGYANINGTEIPIAGNAGDQQAALFGQCCFEEGEAKCTYGTGCFLLMNTGESAAVSGNGLLTTIAATIGERGDSAANVSANSASAKLPAVQYALEGSVFTGGAVIQWLRDELRIISDSADSEYFADKVDDTGGVYLVPAFTGLGAPYWDMYARGCIIGITRGTKREHIIRAAQESIAFQVMDLLKAMESDLIANKINIKMNNLKVDGGASRDAFLMQFQADVCRSSIVRPIVRETTALGAACLAGITTGFWKDLTEVKSRWKQDIVFKPEMEIDKYEKLVRNWHKAVERSRNWVQ